MVRKEEYLIGLVKELIKLPHETQWLEFKVDNDKPDEIGEYISALRTVQHLKKNPMVI